MGEVRKPSRWRVVPGVPLLPSAALLFHKRARSLQTCFIKAHVEAVVLNNPYLLLRGL